MDQKVYRYRFLLLFQGVYILDKSKTGYTKNFILDLQLAT